MMWFLWGFLSALFLCGLGLIIGELRHRLPSMDEALDEIHELPETHHD